jgi:hypothetical protein
MPGLAARQGEKRCTGRRGERDQAGLVLGRLPLAELGELEPAFLGVLVCEGAPEEHDHDGAVPHRDATDALAAVSSSGTPQLT